MTENDARDLLWRWPATDWRTESPSSPWPAAPSGWTVAGELQGWQFRINVIAASLQISAGAPGGNDLAVWVVTAAGEVTEGG